MADSSTTTTTAGQPDHLAHGIRALALKQWPRACDHLALAVQHATDKNGELSPDNVDALILYGKALIGSAIAQGDALGGAAPKDDVPAPSSAAGPSGASATASGPSSSSAAAGPSNPKFHFGGDAEDDDEDEGPDGDAEQQDEGEGDGDEGEGEDGGAPGGADREDDLESAFQVLDLARAIVQREVDGVEGALERAVEGEADTRGELEMRTKAKKERLAEVHRLLGDVWTESEKFDSAVEEYTSALTLLSRVLEAHDRALSELHMLIALALDFVPNATAQAVSHAEKAKDVLLLRLAELEKVAEGERDDKAKREIDDIKGLLGDVDMKIEDLRTVPTAPAPTAADSALEALLRQSQGVVAQQAATGSVNDLSGLVKRKKKAPVAAADKVVEEEVKPEVQEGEGPKGGAEENMVRVKEEEADTAAAAAKRKAQDAPAVEEGAAAKKAKVEE